MIESTAMELTESVERFVEGIAKRPKAQKTASAYARHVFQLAEYARAAGRASWAEVTVEDVVAFVTKRHAKSAYVTGSQAVAAVRRFFEYLRTRENVAVPGIPGPSKIGLPRAPAERRRELPMTAAYMADYFAQELARAKTRMSEPHKIRSTAAAALIYDIGLRISEILALPRSAYWVEGKTLLVPKRGVVTLGDTAAELLAVWVALRDREMPTTEGLLFEKSPRLGVSQPMARQWLWKALRLRANGTPTSPEELRSVALIHALHRGASLLDAGARFGMDRTSVNRIRKRYGKMV